MGLSPATVLITLFTINQALDKNGPNPIVKLPDGSIEGKSQANPHAPGTHYFSFEGIPYAKPPLGSLRFEPPQPNEKWSGVLKTLTNRSSCIQQNGDGSEDCLYLNVFTPTLNTSSNLPVMVWIFSGGFINGDGSRYRYNPEALLADGVVYVAMNYRLGIFGFLSTGDVVSPGNYGLKDQVLALKWVQKNIGLFGGDPKRVTIFGLSAGSVSVSYLVQSPAARGLFYAAMMRSGVSINVWSLSRHSRQLAFLIAASLNVDITNSYTLKEGLKKIDAHKLQACSGPEFIATQMFDNPLDGLNFSPVKEPVHEGAIFTGESYRQVKNGEFTRVPLMIGHTSEEAEDVYFFLPDIMVPSFLQNPENVVVGDLNVTNPLEKFLIGKQIERYYGLNPLLIDRTAATNYVSDIFFNNGITQAVQLQSKYVPVYFYIYSYGGSFLNVSDADVGHAADLPFIFPISAVNSPSDVLMRRRNVRLLTNFAKYRNPTPQREELLQNIIWPKTNYPTTFENLVYLNISDPLKLESNYDTPNLEFWRNLYFRSGNQPYDTY